MNSWYSSKQIIFIFNGELTIGQDVVLFCIKDLPFDY